MKAEEIVSLKTLVGPHVVNAGLKFFIQRAGGEKQKSQIRGIASDLMMIARLWVRSPESDVAKLRLMGRNIRACLRALVAPSPLFAISRTSARSSRARTQLLRRRSARRWSIA